jgi:hypothetical protein
LLKLVTLAQRAQCESCERHMLHDWTTVMVVQNIIKQRMVQANELKSKRTRRLKGVS